MREKETTSSNKSLHRNPLYSQKTRYRIEKPFPSSFQPSLSADCAMSSSYGDSSTVSSITMMTKNDSSSLSNKCITKRGRSVSGALIGTVLGCFLLIMMQINDVQLNDYILDMKEVLRTDIDTKIYSDASYETQPQPWIERRDRHHHENKRSQFERELLSLNPSHIDRYPFTGLADLTSPFAPNQQQHDDNSARNEHPNNHMSDTGFYWQIPRSGGTTLKHIIGTCLSLTQASRTSLDYCDVERDELFVCNTKFGKFVNADTSDDHGIRRAYEMNLVASGLTDVVVSSRFLHAAGLFTEYHKGRAFTVIRDPIERTISTFYYLKEATWERNYSAQYKDMTLLEYVHREDTASDWMVRWLTGKNSEPVLEKSDLEFAKEVLRRKFLVLLTDEMKASVDRLIRYMKWTINEEEASCVKENVAKVTRHNKSLHPKLTAVGSEEYEALKERNQWDLELYDYAIELFVEQWAFLYEDTGVVYKLPADST